MYRANLTWERIKEELPFLVQKELVSKEPFPEFEQSAEGRARKFRSNSKLEYYFRITEKGLQTLQQHQALMQHLDRGEPPPASQ